MADFCKQCSIDMYGVDYKELALGSDLHVVICEGCNWPGRYTTLVDRTGECIANCNLMHGSMTVEDVIGKEPGTETEAAT